MSSNQLHPTPSTLHPDTLHPDTSSPAKPKLLIVDDDESIRTQMKWALNTDYEVFLAADGDKAMRLIKSEHPPLVTLDMGLPPNTENAKEGLRILGQILQYDSAIKVIVVTGNPEKSTAIEAISLGAHDYFTKPIDIEEIKVILKRASYVKELESEYRHLQEKLQQQSFADEIIGSCHKIQEIFGIIRKVATTDVPILITGESGTGKELAARAIHNKSIRQAKPFIPINCGAVPENLMESELFGHEKGAFTGAHIQRKGRVELAHGGTLFLDEIGDMPLSLQVKLLRFLQDQIIERVGGREGIELDVRIIAATNKDIKQLIAEGNFREDLYYRLAVVTIDLPPLRERGEDIVLLSKTFLMKYASGKSKRLSGEAVASIDKYNWPGNVRELENKIRRAITLTEGSVITPFDLGLEAAASELESVDLKKAREEFEARIIKEAIIKYPGNISKVADELGLSRPTIYHFMKKYKIKSDT